MSLTFNHKLRAIGFRITAGSEGGVPEDVDIERTLLEAIQEFPKDARQASLVLSWVKVHGAFVIVEKLMKLASREGREGSGSMRWLAAVAGFAVQKGDHRWKTLARRSKEPVYLFPKEVTESAIRLKGAVDWLTKLNFIVPEGALRIREDDVLGPRELIRRNMQYRNRYIYGPSWRADIITAIERGVTSPAAISRAMGCSYEPAHRVFRQFTLVKGARWRGAMPAPSRGGSAPSLLARPRRSPPAS